MTDNLDTGLFQKTKGGYEVYIHKDISTIAISSPDGRELVIFPEEIFEALPQSVAVWVNGECTFPFKTE